MKLADLLGMFPVQNSPPWHMARRDTRPEFGLDQRRLRARITAMFVHETNLEIYLTAILLTSDIVLRAAIGLWACEASCRFAPEMKPPCSLNSDLK
jgi:hypothetical protein